MPIIEPTGRTRVLVTGGNGYIALWVVRTLLEQGYVIRAIVRSLEKGQHMQELFRSYGDKLQLFVVEDLSKDGAFDEAVKGVDAIEHIASPATLLSVNPDDYIKPAVQGTVGLLESARKFGDKVKCIIITSSVGAIHESGPNHGTVTFDETNWNNGAIQTVKEKGGEAHPLILYSTSKTLAEKAAWDFYKKYKGEVQWDLIVLGAPLQEPPKTPKDLNTSMAIFWDIIANDKSEEELKQSINLVHAQDIADAHVQALRKEKAGGERIIISGMAIAWQQIRNTVHSLKPELHTLGILPHRNPDLDAPIQFIFNGGKAQKILDLKYAPVEKVISDALAYFEERGWLEKPVKA
ncbi:D-lactaldehyde dehydrogenase [Gymnopilus junonius]|uniref:D-lactaldehyde dehydrogenase n=1 Tax=Gymnopilus junonius TaxID=109634 RepID=A0A9P5NP38_GYMJU|nr:D-lactaldehyde dehydrogenase [Gymnopilus junonius]